MTQKLEDMLDEMFGGRRKKQKRLCCPKCKSVDEFSVYITAIAIATTDKTRKLLDLKSVQANLEESLWKCEDCGCVFDDSGDIIV